MTSAAPLWAMVTVTYNSAAKLEQWWAGATIDDQVEWIVVDNASTDGSVAVARSLGARVVRLQRNVGFSAANNVGLDLVRSPWTVFVNPDVAVGPFSDFERLADIAEANEGLVAPQLLNPDGTEQPNGRGLPFLAAKFHHRAPRWFPLYRRDYVRIGLSVPTYVAWVMGAVLAGSTEAFRRIGGWDETYFIYYEDHDIGLRSWRKGYPVVLDPAVKWVHEWQRETAQLNLQPWVHELRSMRAFYCAYPYLRSHRISLPSYLGQLQDLVWTNARA